jgi:hypothetical protein
MHQISAFFCKKLPYWVKYPDLLLNWCAGVVYSAGCFFVSALELAFVRDLISRRPAVGRAVGLAESIL